MFDRNDEVITVLQISDSGVHHGTAKTVLLPQEASYVTLILRKANEQRISKAPVASYSRTRILMYIVAVTVTVMAETYFLRNGILEFFDAGFSTTPLGNMIMLVTTAAGGAFYAWISSLFHRAKYTHVGRVR